MSTINIPKETLTKKLHYARVWFGVFLLAFLLRYLFVHFVNDQTLTDMECIWWVAFLMFKGTDVKFAEVDVEIGKLKGESQVQDEVDAPQAPKTTFHTVMLPSNPKHYTNSVYYKGESQ